MAFIGYGQPIETGNCVCLQNISILCGKKQADN